MSNTKKAVFLLERTKDATSHIIGFYSSEKGAIEAVKRHVDKTIDDEVSRSEHDSQDQRIGIYIHEEFLITRNEVEVDEDVEFNKIEDPDEFPKEEYIPIGLRAEDDYEHHVAEDLGDVTGHPHLRGEADPR